MNRFQILKGEEPPKEEFSPLAKMVGHMVYIRPRRLISPFYEGLLLDEYFTNGIDPEKVLIEVHESFPCNQISVGGSLVKIKTDNGYENFVFEEIDFSLGNPGKILIKGKVRRVTHE